MSLQDQQVCHGFFVLTVSRFISKMARKECLKRNLFLCGIQNDVELNPKISDDCAKPNLSYPVPKGVLFDAVL